MGTRGRKSVGSRFRLIYLYDNASRRLFLSDEALYRHNNLAKPRTPVIGIVANLVHEPFGDIDGDVLALLPGAHRLYRDAEEARE